MSDNVCCPVFDPVPWDEKAHTWEGKAFLTATVKQFFHMPLPGVYGRTITKLQKEAKDNGIMPNEKDVMILSVDISPWKSELYFAVTGEKPGVAMTKLSGEYVSKAFDGPYQNMPQYIDAFEEFAHAMHKKAGRYFFWYTTCPKCARKYGHNYIVVLGEVAA